MSPAQIDEFLARGFLRIPGCFSREVGRAWIEDAAARVAGDPKRWVRQLDPSVDLRVFRPEDPATWVVPNFIIDGDQEVEIARFAPRAWAAICDLLGGRERVATTHWSNYINANLRSSLRGASTIVPPTADSWHLDDPRTDTRLDRIRNGLLTVVMFGDVLPASGGTQIAPDSIDLVARVLAEHPDGYDFVDSDAGARITRQCREFLELTGEAGDVVLLHPFMIHTAAPNPSGRIRWMSNPMIHARGFLDFFRDDPAELSPVELAVARALAASPGASEDAARRQRPKGAS